MASWTREFALDFIDLYRSQECIWKVKSKDYTNRKLKEKAYRILVQKMREIDKNADRDTVTRKINSLRTSFRKELRKVQKSKAPDAKEEAYIPRLWYFENLLFLMDQEAPCQSDSSKQDEDADCKASEVTEENLVEVQLSEGVSSPLSINAGNTSPDSALSIHYPRSTTYSKRTEEKTNESNCKNVFSWGNNHQLLQNTAREDLFDLIGRQIAAKLRLLPNDKRIYAEKLINDVLFEAELGSLDQNYRVVSVLSDNLQANTCNAAYMFSTVVNK